MPRQELTATQEEKMVDLDVSGPAIDVELPQEGAVLTEVSQQNGATKEEEEPRLVIEEEPKEEPKDELQDYSKGVKTRINKLTAKLREAERREQAATSFAENVKKENETLKTRNTTLDGNYIVEFANRITTETAGAKAELKQATEMDDVDKQVEAQQKLARLAVEAQNLKSLNNKRKMMAAGQKANTEPQNQFSSPAQANNQAVAAPPDPKAEQWASRNEWFGKDAAMTMTSFVLHRTLTEEEGFDGTENGYYDEIDKRMREEFPHKFNVDSTQQDNRPAQTVASATRSAKKGRGKNTVRLTPSQVAIAKKLGVPLEEYAKYVKE
jgi:hypothetical protein|tara:strand:+ start:9470 stop:10444 length:975 start_codon:yes stop_codon:yes gene_type:complete